MAQKKYKPTTAGLRTRLISVGEVSKGTKAEKSLLVTKRRANGRNNQGKLTVRHRGGGAKRKYRIIDFKRNKEGVVGIVKSIEYDPNRQAYISLVYYSDGEKSYILSPKGIKVGSEISAGEKADVKTGNTLVLRDIPTGAIIHNVELSIGKGGQLARSAGAGATLMAKSGKYATVKLPSGEVRLINLKCRATIGEVGNSEKRNSVKGKAGANRWLGRRPHVRGSVMNACDHPHGGGEGKAPIGRSGPMTPWGKPTLGYKTRKSKNKYLVKERK